MKRIKKQQIGYFLHIFLAIIFSHHLIVIVVGRNNSTATKKGKNRKRDIEKLLCGGYFLSNLKKYFSSVICPSSNNELFFSTSSCCVNWKHFFYCYIHPKKVNSHRILVENLKRRFKNKSNVRLYFVIFDVLIKKLWCIMWFPQGNFKFLDNWCLLILTYWEK